MLVGTQKPRYASLRGCGQSVTRVIRKMQAEPWITVSELATFAGLSERRISDWVLVLEAAGNVIRQRVWDSKAARYVVSVKWVD